MEELKKLQSEVSSQIESLSLLKERIEKEILVRANAVTPRVGEYWVTSHIKTLDQEQRGKVVRIKREPEKHVYCWYDIEAIEGFTNGYHIHHFDRKASKEEIESALIAEAEGRGFKEGVRIKRDKKFIESCATSPGSSMDEKETLSNGDLYKPKYNADIDRLEFCGYFVYAKGLWAEILKDEPIKIGGYTAKYSDGMVSFGRKSFDKAAIRNLIACMNEMHIGSVNIETHSVTRSEVQEILAGFK